MEKVENDKEVYVIINGKKVPFSKLPCSKCKWYYSMHCPKCNWNKEAKYNVYGG